jgi:hypothetical protein
VVGSLARLAPSILATTAVTLLRNRLADMDPAIIAAPSSE